MNKRERQAYLEQTDRELTRTIEDMRRAHAILDGHPAHDPRTLHAAELARYVRQLESTREYLREVEP